MKASGALRRWIIDGDNLRHAWPTQAGAPLGRVGLCEALGRWGRDEGLRVTVVFDGPAPRAELERQIRRGGAEVIFSGPRSADDLIEALVEQASSPANLVVVSSDHAVRAAARRRMASAMKSQDFVMMVTGQGRAPQQPGAREPVGPEKPEQGCDGDGADWLREFGLDGQQGDDVTDMVG